MVITTSLAISCNVFFCKLAGKVERVVKEDSVKCCIICFCSPAFEMTICRHSNIFMIWMMRTCDLQHVLFCFTKMIYLFPVTFGFCDDPENKSTIYNYGEIYMTDQSNPECDPGQELVGGSVIQCVLGDNPTSTRWNDSLPYCRGE